MRMLVSISAWQISHLAWTLLWLFGLGVHVVMMFFCGYVFARCTGLHPWLTGLVMVAIGCAMVGVAIALGG